MTLFVSIIEWATNLLFLTVISILFFYNQEQKQKIIHYLLIFLLMIFVNASIGATYKIVTIPTSPLFIYNTESIFLIVYIAIESLSALIILYIYFIMIAAFLQYKTNYIIKTAIALFLIAILFFIQAAKTGLLSISPSISSILLILYYLILFVVSIIFHKRSVFSDNPAVKWSIIITIGLMILFSGLGSVLDKLSVFYHAIFRIVSNIIISCIMIFVFIRYLMNQIKLKKIEPHINSFVIDNNLTGREKEVLCLLIQNATYKLISKRLNISLETVKSHISNIYRKSNISGRRELLYRFENFS